MLNRTNAAGLVMGSAAPEPKVKVRMLARKKVQGYEGMREVGEVVEASRPDAVWLVQRGHAEYVR